MKRYYHFTGDRLRDGRELPKVGVWLIHRGKLEPCQSGLHASEHPFDALQFAPGPMLHLVELGRKIIPHDGNKVVARRRKIVATVDATDLLRKFARRVALDVLPLWPNAPEVVKQFLTTGDESLRDAAWAAARAAAWAAARDAAWAAARDAAWAAAWDAAWAAARDAAWAAARDAAWAAAWNKYKVWFLEMVEVEFQQSGGAK
jgi:hypothetical protein